VPGDPRGTTPRWRQQGLLIYGPALASETPPRSIWQGDLAPITIGVVVLITLNAFEAIGSITAMPIVASELGMLADYTWAFNAYTVASLFSMVVSGLWGDARGPRGPLVAGITCFFLGSVTCGLAASLPLLVIGRGLQGMGGGAVMVTAYLIIARVYPESLRPRAFSALSAAWMLPSIMGPFIAGWLADSLSWRFVFWIVPIFIIPVAVLLVPRIGRYQGGEPHPKWRSRLLAGAVATIGLFLLQDGALRLSVFGYAEAVLGVVILLLAVRKVLPTGALSLRRGLPATVMMRAFFAASYFSAEVFIPLALVQIRGVSLTLAGLTIGVSAVAWAGGSYLQSRLSATKDRSTTVRAGAVVIAIAIMTVPLSLNDSWPAWTAGVSWIIASAGMGLAIPSISVQVFRLSPQQDQGVNSAAIQIADAIGFSVGVAVLGIGYAVAVAHGGATAGTFTGLWLASAAIAVVAIGLAGRMRPRAATQ
jgi:MFS family permease